MDLRLGGSPGVQLNFQGDIEELPAAADQPAGGGSELAAKRVDVGGLAGTSSRLSSPPWVSGESLRWVA